MKQFYFILPALALLAGCSSDDIISTTRSEAVAGVVLCAEDFHAGDAMTRSTISTDYKFSWDDADAIGIYPSSGTAIRVPVKTAEGQGSNTAVFDGGDWVLKSGVSYSAFYPVRENVNYFNCEKTSIPVKFTGQVQGTNNSTAHLGAFDYMVATPQASSNGNIHFTFQHVGALLHIPVTVAATDKFASLTISATDNSKIFVTEARLNTITGELSDKVVSNVFTLNLNDIEVSQDGTLDMWMMMAPISGIDWRTTKLTFTVKTYNGAESSVTADGANFEAGKAYSLGSEGKIDPLDIPFVTFTAKSTQTLQMTRVVDQLEYSVNGGSWQELKTTVVTFGGANGNLRLRGSNGKGTGTTSENTSSTIVFGNGTKVECSGDIRTLANYQNWTLNKSYVFGYLFKNCTQLISTPLLKATTLSPYCYQGMFSGCNSLTSAPVLPATTLAEGCYSRMFVSCASLSDVPTLPAGVMKSRCYYQMFAGCKALSSTPELSAMTLSDLCYYQMFANCTSLATAPTLPATTLATRCYEEMFSGCSSLSIVPDLPATTLAERCCFRMFWNCTSLTTAPALPATTLAPYCYQRMFERCQNLNYIKMMAVNIGATDCLDAWTIVVSSTGTFVKNRAAEWNVTGSSGIPSGWTIEYEGDDLANLDGELNGHGYVDLGITDTEGHPVYWATCNVGAKNPEDYGGYYAWGETKAQNEEDISNMHNYAYNNFSSYIKKWYYWASYKWATGETEETINKYYSIDGKTRLESSDDAATTNWGEGWRMPTTAEFTELVNNCYWCPTSNGVGFIVYKAKCANDKGYVGITPTESYTETDKHIILPQPDGWSGNMVPHDVNRVGFYWCSDLNSSDRKTNTLYINNYMGIHVSMKSGSSRCAGLSVRPVCVIADRQ